VVTRHQPDRATRLVNQLVATLRRRQELMAAALHPHFPAYRTATAEQPPAHIVVLVDNWKGFTSSLGDLGRGSLVDSMITLMREGPAAGIHVIVTGDHTALTGRLAGLAEQILCLRLADRNDYSLAGINPRTVSGTMGPGRAVQAEAGIEMQIAALSVDLNTEAVTAALTDIGTTAKERDVTIPLALRPFPVDDVWLADDRFHVGDAHGHPIGREEVLAWLRDRSATVGAVALLGQRRAGKTWVLNELEDRLTRDGMRRVQRLVIPEANSAQTTSDDIAKLLDHELRQNPEPAATLIEAALAMRGADRLVFLLDEVGHLATYQPAAVSWLRTLGQAGAWLVFVGTEKDWNMVFRHAHKATGSSFGNDVEPQLLGPFDERTAHRFLTGTAANLGVTIEPRCVHAILEQVGAWPFYLQAVGDAVVRRVQVGDRGPLDSPERLRQLIEEKLLDRWTTHFWARWQEIGEAGRAALRLCAQPTPADLAPAQRADLREVGLLLTGERWLPDRPFFDWITRNSAALHDEDQR
jgi:S-DNA-T family DNA segregation ATPase FtsK/SpoIIIE